jgi:nucleotide-binding universal stress UspA family protein
MFKHILVPLDGSQLAEAVLPAARYLAEASLAKVTLIHVLERDAPATVHGERHLRTIEEAERYLDEVCVRNEFPERGWDRHVHGPAIANVAQAIVQHQGELTPDLIVMCTHGRSGLKRLLIGSIAQQVVGAGHTPVLLIQPSEADAKPFDLKVLLAPVDGDPRHDQGLEFAAGLACMTNARLEILSVVPTMATLAGKDATLGKFMPGTTQAFLEMAEADLGNYCSGQVARLEAQKVTVAARIERGDPASIIAQTAVSLDASLIILATHGKSGNRAFWTNSVAAKVQAQTRRPLLLIPLKNE